MTRPHLFDTAALAELAPPPDTTLPNGLAVELDGEVRRSRDSHLMLGGSPTRLLRLSKPAAQVLRPGMFTVADAATAALARKLVDTGIAHPRPPAQPVRDLTIVIPVRDRASMLHQLLAALRTDPQTSGVPALVVDDGSVDGTAVASVARRHGATLLVHRLNRGPAVARNTGLRHARTGYVAFCDSDVLPEPGWLGPLLAQFADPALALAAPRVVGIPPSQPRWLDRYEDVRSPLDMGGREAPVVPLSALHYWPVAVLAAVMSRRARHVLVTGAVLEGLIDFQRSGSPLNPLVYLLIRRLDDLAYGAGLWCGAIRDRTAAPLIPRLARRTRHARAAAGARRGTCTDPAAWRGVGT
jgi:hypothetical protein